MLAHRADIAVDRHAVVVQNHDERLAARARVVKSLVGKAAGERAVAATADDVARTLGRAAGG